MTLLAAVRTRYHWGYPASAAALLICYFVLLRPLRVLFTKHISIPFFEFLLRGNAIHVDVDAVGTGTLFKALDSGLVVVIGAPGGMVFLVFAILLLLFAVPMRYLTLLIVIHLAAYAAALVFAITAGFSTLMLLHGVPLIQYYVVLAASFSILFFSLRDYQYWNRN